MNENLQELWQKWSTIVRDIVGDQTFDTWFSCAKPVSFENGVLNVYLPTMYYKELYDDRFYDLVKKSVRRVFGEVKVCYSVPAVTDDATTTMQFDAPRKSAIATNPAVTKAQGVASPFSHESTPDIDPQLNPAYNFDNYCVGESNHLPFVIAEWISKNPHKAEFNPFFLYGDVGVGKTHLVQAIGLHLKENNPALKVCYVTYRQFHNQYYWSYDKKAIPQFIRWYEGIDVLIIDDLQEISGHWGTMKALFPIFNHLHQHGKKLIFTCDRPPVELDGVTDRLIDRFKWGVVERLPKPDLALRKAILKFKAAKNGLNSIPEEVIDVIAEYADSSVRQLEGIVMGILTNSIARRCPITVELAREVMQHSVKVEKHSINFDMIVEATAGYYNLNPDVLFSKSRVRDIADARQLIMYLAHKHTSLSSPAIGAKLNRRHATVLYGIKTVADRIPFSKELAKAVELIEADLRSM